MYAVAAAGEQTLGVLDAALLLLRVVAGDYTAIREFVEILVITRRASPLHIFMATHKFISLNGRTYNRQ